MISVEEALQTILNSVNVLGAEEEPLLACLGQVLVEDVVSGIDIPPSDNSGMDGVAVRAVDTQRASPASPKYLDVIGEIQAGHESSIVIREGLSARIMTGAPIPDGADAVVKFEDTDDLNKKGKGGRAGKIGILNPAFPGLNIRLRGEDIRAGQTVLKKGTSLWPAEIGILAALGHQSARVIRRPLVAILPTGHEISNVGTPLPPGRSYNSNTYTLAASVLRCGGVPMILDIARDSAEALSDQMSRSLGADLLITSGGVSMGDYDVVKDVMGARGEIVFWQVRMKPGKPMAFGLLNRTAGASEKRLPHLALPGNPVSSMLTFEVFARPAILKMMGKMDLARPTVVATLAQDIANGDGRRVFARVRVSGEAGDWKASLTGPQGSGILTSMSGANGLAVVAEGCLLAKAGSKVTVILLDDSE
jgi:molybdopterin molybdotransferase